MNIPNIPGLSYIGESLAITLPVMSVNSSSSISGAHTNPGVALPSDCQPRRKRSISDIHSWAAAKVLLGGRG